MRHTDSTRHLAAVPDTTVYRTCTETYCEWSALRPDLAEADLAEAAHWVETHATPAARERIAARVEGWQRHWAELEVGDFPARLLVQTVDETRRGAIVAEVAA